MTKQKNTFFQLAIVVSFLVVGLVSCYQESYATTDVQPPVTATLSIENDTIFYLEEYLATSFDFPVGKPNAKGYYNAQRFGENYHLGDDWNAVTGGNSDLGDPIYAIANGYVNVARNVKGGWGNIIRIHHKLPNGEFVESLYAHCDTILVNENSWVKKGDQIGTIGTAFDRYPAHLHLEMRDTINLPLGGGYSRSTKGYLNPTKFINEH